MSKSAHKNPEHNEALKYEPVPVVPMPSTLEELESHLRAFIEQFIAKDTQERWIEFLIEKRSDWFPPEVRAKNLKIYRKADALLNMFPSEGPHCHEIKGADNFPHALSQVYGTKRGVYFDLSTEPCKMTAAEAATKATEDYVNAILSFVPGKKALVFNHEGGVWLYEKG